MDSLDPNQDEKKGGVVEHHARDDGELALEVDVLEAQGDDQELEAGVHEDPEGYHEDQDGRPILYVRLVFVSTNLNYDKKEEDHDAAHQHAGDYWREECVDADAVYLLI